jgi:hypothetical protein
MNATRLHHLFPAALCIAALTLAGCGCCADKDDDAADTTQKAAPTAADAQPDQPKLAEAPLAPGWHPLFDGKTLTHWKTTEFGGHRDARVEDGAIIIPSAEVLGGVNYTKPLPKTNYEVEAEAQRVDGNDFFYGLTFPVKESHASLIVGGWGGGVVGISSIDGMDASENETTTYQPFEKGKWYKVRLRVLDDKIIAWLDGDKLVEANIKGRQVGVRPEVELSKPFGFSAYQTSAALRNIRIRNVTADTPGPDDEKKPQGEEQK